MSTISNVHNIIAYTTGVTKPFSGQRLSTCTYKTDKVSGIKPDSVCVSIPQVASAAVVASINEFIPHIIALCERTQDAIIRSVHEAKRTQVSDDELSVNAILAYLEEDSAGGAGGRIKKEDAAKWFDQVIADPLALALAQRLGASTDPTAEQSDKIESLLIDFKDKVSSLTAGNVKHSPDVIAVLRKAIAFAPDDDVIAGKFIARLDVLARKVSVSIADSL